MPPKTSANKAQEKIELELRKLTRLEGNKTCVDCVEKMPGYVNLTHHTFVCTRCSGIHRELQFKVKGISMSVFSAEDVADVAAGGNVAHNAIYMARHTAKESVPNGSDVTKLRDFIKAKYNDKKWYSNGSTGGSSDRVSSSGSVDQPSSDSSDLWGTKKSSTSRGTIAIKETPKAAPSNGTFGLDLLDLDPVAPVAPAKPQVSQAQHQFNNANQNAFNTPQGGGGFAAFGDSNNTGFDAFGGQTSGGFDAFGGQQQAPATAPAASGMFDAFNSPRTSQQPVQQQQQQQQQSGFGDFSSGFPTTTPHVPQGGQAFIKVSPPTAAEKAAEDAILAAAIASKPPPPKNFNVFDEINPTPVMHPGYGPPAGYPGGPPGPFGPQGPGSANPFDTGANPFGSPAYGAPGGNPFGVQGPPGPYGHPPQGYYPGGPQGMPPQGPGPYGFHPQGPPGPYGYPPQGYPPQQQQPHGYPPFGFPPNGPNGAPQAPGPGPAYPPYVPKTVKPPEPVAPDPFSLVGGLGWGEVSKPTTYTPSPNTISAGYHPPASASPVSPSYSSPPPQQQQQQQIPTEHQFDPYGKPQAAPAPAPSAVESGNPFDLF